MFALNYPIHKWITRIRYEIIAGGKGDVYNQVEQVSEDLYRSWFDSDVHGSPNAQGCAALAERKQQHLK